MLSGPIGFDATEVLASIPSIHTISPDRVAHAVPDSAVLGVDLQPPGTYTAAAAAAPKVRRRIESRVDVDTRPRVDPQRVVCGACSAVVALVRAFLHLDLDERREEGECGGVASGCPW